jgi:hypothetical protein
MLWVSIAASAGSFLGEIEDMMANRAERSLCVIIARSRGCRETKHWTTRLFNVFSGGASLHLAVRRRIENFPGGTEEKQWV